jgi:hypothetical protein
MVEMTRFRSVPLRPEFDVFLFAPVGEDRGDMPLSVLSALARLGVDPRQEAAQLALLPMDAARQRLASLIAALPAGPSAHRDPGAIAARLIALLPRQAVLDIPSRATGLGAVGLTKSRAIIYVIFMVFMLGAQCIFLSHQPSKKVGDAQVSGSSAVVPRDLPPNSGR